MESEGNRSGYWASTDDGADGVTLDLYEYGRLTENSMRSRGERSR